MKYLSSSPETMLPPHSNSGAAGVLPETVVSRVTKTGETGMVLLAYRIISEKASGLYSDHVAEFLMQARVLQPHNDTHTVEYVSLSDQEAEELCGDELVEKLVANRAATASESVVRVELNCSIELKPLPFGRSNLEIDAEIDKIGTSASGTGTRISRARTSGLRRALGSAIEEVADKTFRGGKKDRDPASARLTGPPPSSSEPPPAADGPP
ncbi:hypothetical protein TeGR_g10840, partial [Tetraparma gracilis]